MVVSEHSCLLQQNKKKPLAEVISAPAWVIRASFSLADLMVDGSAARSGEWQQQLPVKPSGR